MLEAILPAAPEPPQLNRKQSRSSAACAHPLPLTAETKPMAFSPGPCTLASSVFVEPLCLYFLPLECRFRRHSAFSSLGRQVSVSCPALGERGSILPVTVATSPLVQRALPGPLHLLVGSHFPTTACRPGETWSLLVLRTKSGTEQR